MRLLGIDYGRRRIGLALSDPSGMLARPWRTIEAAPTPHASAAVLSTLLETLRTGGDEEAGDVRAAIVGLPRRLSGEEHEQSQAARRFADELGRLSGLQVYLQDERLSSVEADERLAVRERDWRVRKRKLDAAAAAIILQDFIDGPARTVPQGDQPA